METVDTVDKPSEVVWCTHALVSPLYNLKVPVILSSGTCYIVIEERKIKILCRTCFQAGISKAS